MECVYYAVRTESLNIIQINFVFTGFTLNPQKLSVTKNLSFWVSKKVLYILGRKVEQSTVEYKRVDIAVTIDLDRSPSFVHPFA
jgi:hypothetical protein